MCPMGEFLQAPCACQGFMEIVTYQYKNSRGCRRVKLCDIIQDDKVRQLSHVAIKLFVCMTTLPMPCSTLILNSFTISVRYKCLATFPIAASLLVKHGFH